MEFRTPRDLVTIVCLTASDRVPGGELAVSLGFWKMFSC